MSIETDDDTKIESYEDELFTDEDSEDESGYRVENPLPLSSWHSFTTKELHRMIHEGVIDLNPVWQREEVWVPKKQSHLIDSLLRNYYIPPVIFALTEDEDGDEVRICVDGKQRLTSIQKFIDGQIPCRYENKLFFYTTSSITKKNRIQLSDRYKNIFSSKQITCVEYKGLEDDQIRDLFQRVQNGVPLRPAERLQALSTLRADWVGRAVEDYIRVENGLSVYIDWNTKNGLDFFNVAMTFFACECMDNQPTPTSPTVERWLKRADIPSAGLKSRIDSMLAKVLELASNADYRDTFRKKRVAPAEFVFMCIAVYVLNEANANDDEIIDAFERLRTGLRDRIEVRMNSTLCQQAWPFITALQDDIAAPFRYNSNAGVSKRRKRKQEDDSDGFRGKRRG